MKDIVSRALCVLVLIFTSASQIPFQAQSRPAASRNTPDRGVAAASPPGGGTTSGKAASGGGNVSGTEAGRPRHRGAEHRKASKASYELGVKYGVAGRFLEAVEAFRDAIIYQPDNADAHFGLGHAYFDLSQWSEAAGAFKQSVSLNPKDYEAYVYLGASYFRLGMYEQAVEAYKGAILIDRKSSEPRFNIANAFLKLRRFDPAITYYTDFLHFKPNSAAAHNGMGVAYGEAGNIKKALEAFKRALEIDSNDMHAQGNLAVAHHLLGQYPEAAKAFDRAARLAPGNPVVRDNLRHASADLNPAGVSRGEPVALVMAGGDGARKSLRWLSRSDLILGIDKWSVPKATGTTTAPESITPRLTSQPVPTRNKAPEVIDSAKTKAPEVLSPPKTNDSSPKEEKKELAARVTPAAEIKPPAETRPATPAVNLYRVGVGDVLDIRVLNESTSRSTLYTVSAGGLLEYPALPEPFKIAGMTTEEVAALIASELRRRAIEVEPRVLVNVREYVSHTIIVSGLVAEPGAKIIRREEIPLYVVMADAQPLPEAARVLVKSYASGRSTEVALDDQAAMNLPLRSGDVIVVSKKLQQFYYIGGKVGSPGQKEFHEGITLTQAIMSAGGELHKTRSATRSWMLNARSGDAAAPPAGGDVQVARGGPEGLLKTATYNLKEIMSGKAPDPLIEAGDRIEVRD